MPDVHVILTHDHSYPNINSDELTVLLDELTAVIRTIEPPKKKSKLGFPSGSIGDVSARIGYDVRDILMAGYSHGDIAELGMSPITAEELRKRGPQKD